MESACKVHAKTQNDKSVNSISQSRNNGCRSVNSPAEKIMFLQRTAGNQAVQRLIKSGALQAKLRVGQPNDIYEQEADRVAEQVMSMPEPQAMSSDTLSIQRTCPRCEEEKLRRQPVEEEEEKGELLQTKEISGQNAETTPDLESRINAIRGGGQPLTQSIRDFFEPRFGSDFSQVRVHTGTHSAESARMLKAQAYTIGRDIVFGSRQYAPDANKGKRLLAHELAHVVQQRHSSRAAHLSSQVNSQGNKGKLQVDKHVENFRHESDNDIELTHQAHVVQRRECPSPERLGRVAPLETCVVADPNTRVPDRFRLPLRFCYDSDDLIDSDAGNMAALRSRIQILTLGERRSVHIHGYSSLPGRREYNRRLACHRAVAVKNMLRLQTRNPIILHTHGATSVFGAQAENQRVVVVTSSAPPPVRPSPVRPSPRPSASGPFLDLQIACVIDRDGCSNTANIPLLDALCRIRTGYSGVPVVKADLVCTKPGMGIAQSLERAYPGWRGRLPNCPCTRTEAVTASNFSRDLNPLFKLYHPGAHVCYRSTPVASVPGTEHRQHCCYTRSGILITQGSGAGTPDVWSNFFRHQRIDRQPFDQFHKDWKIYNMFWIPNQGSGCGVVSDPCINRCEQLFDMCGAGPACLARRSMCLRQCRPRPSR